MRIIIMAVLLLTASPVMATKGFCGVEPIPPASCMNPRAICICDSEDNCSWSWICEQ